jgi:hypothetical protein
MLLKRRFLWYTYAVILEKRVGALEEGSGINPGDRDRNV